MTTVSIQEVRFEFKKVKCALERGEELLLTFRNRPLARITPVSTSKPTLPRDPALDFASNAENLPVISNQEIDTSVYG